MLHTASFIIPGNVYYLQDYSMTEITLDWIFFITQQLHYTDLHSKTNQAQIKQ